MNYIRENKLKGFLKKGLCGLLALIMLITAFPLQAIAAKLDYDDLASQKSTYINKVDPVTPAVLDGTKSAKEYIKDPEMPEIYTLYSDYLVQKDHKWKVNYQPYVASVGANATPGEQANVNKTINLPDLKGYEKPQDSFNITYDSIVKEAKTGEKTGDTWQKNQEFRYDAKESSFYVKHVFQSLTDFNEYGKKDGETDDHLGLVTGRTGSLLDIQPLDESLIEGFTPEADKLTSMVPENTSGFQVEYRYNRNAYEIDYDTDGGSDLDSRLLYYGQVIPKVKEPTKKGSVFLGWKPSTELKGTVNNVSKTFAANEIIKDGADNAIKDLDANLIVPAKDLVFTAVWKDAPKADYLIQFWTEKPDYDDKDDTLPLRDRYDYIGSRRVENADTGLRPDLTNLDIHGITFPDLNDGRLEKAQNSKEEFERYYFLNKELTKKQNRSKKDPNVQKSVLSTGETVYNVYYDRRVYTLYFTAANELAFENAGSFWPIITRNGQVIGQEGSPYKAEVRFNQSLNKIWPKDEEVSNLPPGSSDPEGDTGLIGWIINNNAGESIFRDTPPYRLSAEDFIDAEDVMSEEDLYGYGHSDEIPIKDGENKKRDKYEISLGSTSLDTAVVHHIDIIKDDFDGKEQIDYDMSYWKSDTNAVEYPFILPHLQGFTLKETNREAEWVLENPTDKPTDNQYRTINDLNRDRNKITPFRSDADKIKYIPKFPWGTKLFDGKNAYNYANYTRNKYKLKLNNDPKNIKNDNEYTDDKDRFDVFYEMPLNNLQLDTNKKPEKPAWVPENWEFKGWATDPAGENLLKDGKETKLHYDQFLFAKWGEPDYKWKVTIDPDGGTMKNITVEDLIFRRNEYHNVNKSAVKEANDGNKQIFTVNHREKLNKVQAPKRKGYDFLGWQVIRYNKDGSVDTSYRKEYGVPELYAFGNDVVGDVYIKAIWLANNKIDVPVFHHFIDKDGNEIGNPRKFVIEDARAKYYTAATATEQNQDWILMPHEELIDLPDENKVKQDYIKYNEHHKFDNTDIHSLKVEPLFILGEEGDSIPNPKAEYNEFHFYYRRFKTRDYKVNYLDKKAQAEIEKIIKSTDTVDAKKEAIKAIVDTNSIIPQEEVVSRNRHYDARNYRTIPGWKLASDPQQQLFYDVDEATGEFKGINGTGLDEIFFYYEDVRVIDVPKDDPVPDGYVRITFKADKGGAFTDKNGNPKTEIYYDVIKGLKSDLLVVPQELKEGATKEDGKYYITPDSGKKFTKWDEKPLLNDNTIIDRNYTFTAYFDWSDVKIETLVVTESFKDQDGNWINNFIPTEDKLKAQVKKLDKNGKEVAFPTGTEITIKDSADDIYEKLRELGKDDSTELVREVKIKAEIKFSDNSKQEIEIPVKVYKNVYEALTSGAMPKVLKDATEADGDLINVTGEYVKVTVNPTGKPGEKDSKIYYVNKNALVNIPEIKLTEAEKKELGFTHWSADKDAQNENGVYDFNKRHKFTEDTVISPGFEKDVVEQTDPDKKPPVPESYVKVIVKTTDKATDDTAFEKIFWVNSTKEVTIDVTNPTGKTVQADPTKVGAVGYTMKFSKWQSEEDTPRTWEDKIVGKFEKETTIVAKYSVTPEEVKDQVPKTDPVHTPQGKTPTVDEIKDKITPPDGKTIKNVTIVEEPDVTNPGNTKVKVIVEYDDGSSVGTNDNPLEIKVEVHKNIIPAGPNGEKPEGALDNYVKVIFKAGTGGKLEDTLTGNFIYYVSPEVQVDMTEVAGKIKKAPDTGYFVNGEKWNNKDNKALKGTFTDDETVFEFVFDKSTDIIEKTDDPNQVIPKGYVKVTFKTEDENKGKLEGDVKEKIYYVNPKADIKLKVLGENETATDKQLVVPKPKANTNFTFKEWQENIDEKTSITSERVHVAIFQSGKVTLTYEANGATGTVPPAVSVDHGTSVRLASAAGLTKKDAKFAGWKIGDKTYQAGDLVTLEESKTAVAQWINDKNIIPYDPSDPITRPDNTYVRVTFEADNGLKLTESKAYYVKKDAKITLAELTKPAYEEKTGYKFKEWDKEDALAITEDTLVTAKANPIPDTIEKKDGVDKPKGYVEVDFTAGINGSLEGDKVYYVNPSKYVTLVPPTPIGDTGFEFSAWDINPEVPRVYTDPVTTITASFNPIDAVSITPKPGYVKVDFVIEGKGGQIAQGETTTYYVDPNRKVTLNAPTTVADVGYEFNTWTPDPKVLQAYKTATTIKGTFAKLADIIPSTDGQGKENPKPDGYVTVTFDKGEHGKEITGQTVYYVNPKANKTLGDLTRPKVEEEIGYKFTKWDKLDSKVISEDLTVSAIYDKIPDVIPKDKPQGGENDKPEGYITVSFSAEKNGKLEGTSIYYIKPNTAVALKGLEPRVIPNTGFDFANWDTQIEKKIEYSDGDVIKALYNAKDNVIPQKNTDGSDKPEGYFTVRFDKGEHGKELTGQTVYYVKPNVEVTVPDPSVKANIGYDFKDWDKNLTQTFTKDETITAEYTSKDDIIPQKNTDGSDKPEGYKTVKFVGVNGKLEGTLVYYVNPEKVVDLTDKVNVLTKTPDFAYTEVGGTWNPTEFNKKFTEDLTTFTFTFVRLQNVIPKNNPDGSTNKQPDGYVKVTLIPTDKATDATKENKVYFVNPKEQVTIPSTDPVGREITDAKNNTYTFLFKEWAVTRGTITPSWGPGIEINGKFNQDTDITAKYNVKAEKLTNGPLPKDNVVTGKGDVPNPEDLIKNIFDPNDPNNKDNLPDGTTFTYTNDGTPDVNNPGKTTAKVEVHYPDGKTSVVEVPIKVVDHVVPQIGGENCKKPLVPDTYVKVTVDTTDNATPNTKFVKVFWVKPNVEVTIPDILAPTGKAVVEDGVTKTNRFVKWQLVGSDPAKFYETEITDTFTKDETIVATYEFDKNVEPVGKNDQWIPQGSNSSPKDFIENPYDDNDPNNPNNLPPGTKFEFVPGTEPNTNEPGTNKETKIKITYPNGETREVPVTYNVTGDVVEQPDPNDPNTKPAVPDNYVKVIVDKTENAQLQPGEQQTQVFWVNPEKVVTIPVNNPTGREVTKDDGTKDFTWLFTGWDNNLTQQFKAEETIITAQYKKDYGKLPEIEPIPEARGGFIYTDLGKPVNYEDYKSQIFLPDGYSFETGTTFEIDRTTEPNIYKTGLYSVKAWVNYPDGKGHEVTILVYVGKANVVPEQPPQAGGIKFAPIYVEKVVEVAAKANILHKEVRYMQGFNGYFRPNDGLTRAEAAQILANALKEDGYNYNPNYQISYKDIGNEWYTEAIRITTEANVFAGYDDGFFRPEKKITRAEWIATLRRFQNVTEINGNHMNVSENHWAKNEIEAAFNEGWLKIYSDGLAKFNADEFIPRQEVAAVSNLAFNRVFDKTYINRNDKALINQYKDVKPSMWAYEDILCASNTFVHDENLYRAHDVKNDKITFNVNLDGLEIIQDKFQRIPR